MIGHLLPATNHVRYESSRSRGRAAGEGAHVNARRLDRHCSSRNSGAPCFCKCIHALEQRLTTASFNILNDPVARGHFLGNYMGLAASGPTTVYPLFGVAGSQGRQCRQTLRENRHW
ncbi:hypothetical protein BN2476_930013 [Paraburkholderia piptadeniae]|uniref:Uncharacterized protein n=1 Tax=Paraburkholderia piptadeniae TaxID=1701573 RepID=A0A1N7STJ2_9BURK|nr:hypothetical protein BN2476_930013 [Paraburkholderia piptadeniae]